MVDIDSVLAKYPFALHCDVKVCLLRPLLDTTPLFADLQAKDKPLLRCVCMGLQQQILPQSLHVVYQVGVLGVVAGGGNASPAPPPRTRRPAHPTSASDQRTLTALAGRHGAGAVPHPARHVLRAERHPPGRGGHLAPLSRVDVRGDRPGDARAAAVRREDRGLV
jgi:hypothetical protein